MKCLYHYCSNEKCFAILNGKKLRLSDIQKSNDYRELSLFFPELLYVIEDFYKDDPFPFKYKNQTGADAFFSMTRKSYSFWRQRFINGNFSNFVICFSEAVDSLSQWRGYADNGKGCCIGFSLKQLQEYCEKNKNVLRIEKVEYVTDRQIMNRIRSAAKACIDEMKTMRDWIIDNMTHNDDAPDTDGLLHFNFDSFVESVFIDTLRLKSCAFSEEQEWRIFFKNPVQKDPKWICRKEAIDLQGPDDFSDTISFLNNKIQFNVTDDDIIPFCPIDFEEFSENPVLELWTGPKSKIREKDIELFLKQKGYTSTRPYHSRITYC